MHYLALGDSYTIGEGVAEHGRWPVQLADALRREGIAISDPRIIATTGWTTSELSAAMAAEEPLGKNWGLVTLLIGVNNQYRGEHLDDYRREFTVLLDRAIACADGRASRVLVPSIPDWGVTPHARRESRDRAQIARDIDAFNATAHAVCDNRGVTFIDITAISRRHGGESDMLANDGLHPSAAMYGLWTGLILPVARDRLRNG
ncbi:SGNH/GDSL hydrolase family protein [Solilutibacter silvestris]|uniref:SGNH/GDSL hydrolase family protein n=1 Tax=Solilutibacter silvestris TaxID=1645665 RepID=UPI000CA0137C|nr:SGNH/GDSL hydrolase family protein [Lysobacter silvestris]